MPITPVQAVGVLVPSLAGVTMIGLAVPKFCLGLGTGLSTWTPSISVSTIDVGAVGTGKGVPTPITLATPVLYANLFAGFLSEGLLGLAKPLFLTGLSLGLTTLYLQAFTNTVHVGVGSGAGVATFSPPPAAPQLIAGFAVVGMTGDGAVKTARAIAKGMEATFGTLSLPQPIVGPVGPSPGSGTGFGSII